jgi:peptidoglycan hydrolase-like protein with peptidoglycan-binding domain
LLLAGKAAAMTSKAAVTSIQSGLTMLGYAPGPIDGFYGPKTREAAEAWLANDGRPAPSDGPAPALAGAMLHQGARRHPVQEIVVHCSATRPNWFAGRPTAEKVAEIRKWHVEDRGWSDIGYHHVIDRDGTVVPGRAETRIGAHVAGRNTGTIGIVLLGGFGAAETDAFADHFTEAQDAALRALIADIQIRTQITKISGHNEYAAKACPGFAVGDWF